MKMVNFGFFLTAIFTVLLTTSIQPGLYKILLLHSQTAFRLFYSKLRNSYTF